MDASVFRPGDRGPAGLQESAASRRSPGGGLDRDDQCSPGRADAQERLQFTYSFYKPSDFPANWEQNGSLADAALSLASLSWLTTMALKAKRFGSVTSGQALLFTVRRESALYRRDKQPRVGIPGDNAGRDAIMGSCFTAQREDLYAKSTQVYGCSLIGPK